MQHIAKYVHSFFDVDVSQVLDRRQQQLSTCVATSLNVQLWRVQLPLAFSLLVLMLTASYLLISEYDWTH